MARQQRRCGTEDLVLQLVGDDKKTLGDFSCSMLQGQQYFSQQA